jgi:hypothetical protein
MTAEIIPLAAIPSEPTPKPWLPKTKPYWRYTVHDDLDVQVAAGEMRKAARLAGDSRMAKAKVTVHNKVWTLTCGSESVCIGATRTVARATLVGIAWGYEMSRRSNPRRMAIGIDLLDALDAHVAKNADYGIND